MHSLHVDKNDVTPNFSGQSNSSDLISFVIPAKDEAEVIGMTLESIRTACSRSAFKHEMILVDNGSTDETAAIARGLGAVVASRPDLNTISAVRNCGAKLAQGRVLVFLDADTTIDADWGSEFSVSEFVGPDKIVGGSNVVPPDEGGWIQHTWFGVENANRSFINSAHLIMGRQLFHELNGFDESLETCEDHDICQRALDCGAELRPNAALVATHNAFPKNLGEFIRRELWHGLDSVTWDQIRTSLTSKITLAILFSPAVSMIAILLSKNWLWSGFPIATVIIFAAGATLIRPRKSILHLPAIFVLYVVYLATRTWAAALSFVGRRSPHWKASNQQA